MKLLIFYCSVRPQCMNTRVFKLIKRIAEEMKFEVVAIDHDAYQREIVRIPYHFYPDPSKAPKELADINSLIKSADAYLFTCAEYNRTIPPALTNMLDHFSPLSYAYKPAGMIGYTQGPGATISSLSHLRMMLSELGCMVVPDICSIPLVQTHLDEEGNALASPPTDAFKAIKTNIERVLKQVQWMGEALIEQKKKEAPPKLHEYV